MWLGAVEVQHTEKFPVPKQRHDDLRARRSIAGNVAGKFFHVRHENRFPPFSSGATHAFADGNSRAGGFALKRTEHKFLSDQPIKPGPIQIRQCVKNQRSCVGEIDNRVTLPMQQSAKLFVQFAITGDLVHEIHGTGFEHDGMLGPHGNESSTSSPKSGAVFGGVSFVLARARWTNFARVRKIARELRGKRIFLRAPASEDFRAYAELMRVSKPVFRELIQSFNGRRQFNEYLGRCRREDFYGFLICRREDGAVLGNINLFQIVRLRVQNAVIGYFVGAPYVRQGYATEALQLMLRFAFRELKLHRVEASIQSQNAASIALVKRAGFIREGYSRRLVKIGGRWRDHERWAILVEDWRRLKHVGAALQ